MKKEMNIMFEVLGKYEFSPIVAHAFKFFLRNPYESLIIVDKNAGIQFMDRGSEKLFGLRQGAARGGDIREYVPQSGLPIALETGIPMIGRIFEVKGKKRIGSVYPIILDGRIIGAVGRLIFHSLEEVEKINNEINRLKRQINHFKEKEQTEYSPLYTFDNILGKSVRILEAVELARKVSFIDTDVLIVGNSGTGKELFAHSIHQLAHGRQPFVKVNCPTIPFELAESELFGYEKGAFSGALPSGKVGKFEMANNGTIFLDEISSLPLSIQAKLLRVLQEREIERLGGTRTKKINFRLIAATNIDLKKLVKEARFRDDLYYRMAKAIIRIPPLKERKEDIPIYVGHFLEKINQSFKTQVRKITNQAMDALLSYHWPGNVRELINILEQAVLKSWGCGEILEEHLPPEVVHHPDNTPEINRENTENMDFKREIEEKERSLILSAIRETKGNRKKAAKLINMPRSTFYEKLKKYGIKD